MGTRSKFGILAFLLLSASLSPLVLPIGGSDGVTWEAPTAGVNEAAAEQPDPQNTDGGREDESKSRAGREEVKPAEEPTQQFERDAVYGQVRDEKEGRIAGARIELLANPAFWTLPEKVLDQARSDQNGRFRFPGLQPFTTYSLRCEADERVPVTLQVHAGQDLRIVLPRASSVFGQVLSATDKTPLGGVSLSFLPNDNSRERPITTRSDAGGNYRLPAPAGSITVWARREGEGALPEPHGIRVEPDKPTKQDILLADAVRRTGEVFDGETGAPVAGAVIRGQTPDRTIVARTDASGKFMLSGAARRMQGLLVEAPGYGSSRYRQRGEQAGPLRIPLLKGAVLEGTVMDSSGKPLEGARLTTGSATGFRTAAERRPFEERARAAKARMPKLPPGVGFDDSANQVTWTDGQGRFRLTGLVSDSGLLRVTARASLPGYCETSSSPVELPVIGGIASVLIQMPRGAAVEGRVFAAHKPARANVQVQVGGGGKQHGAATNDGGEYRIADLPAGQASIEVTLAAHNFIKDKATVALQEGGVAVKDFDLDARVATISGRVMDASGAPAGKVTVHARTEQKGARGYGATTAADGSFQIHVPEVPSSQFALTASRPPASITKRGVVPSPDTIELTLPALGKVLLRVVDEEDGSAIPEFSLSWKNLERRSWEQYPGADDRLKSGPDGTCEITLPAGLVDLRVSARDQNHLATNVEGLLVMAAPVERRVALRRAGTLLTRFVGEGAFPRDHEFFLVRFGPNGLPSSRTQIEMDGSGQAQVEGIEPGTWRIQAEPADLVFTPAEIVVRSGRSEPVEIRWSRKEQEKTGEKKVK